MSTSNDEYRAVEYWPNEDQRIIFALKRDEETDAMTDEQLIARFDKWRREREEEPRNLRAVTDD
ncbi:hypothetical protein [Streptomyces sp. NPDC002573]|uniref:hypothetical protein n=1 Tax=Streptomyces sp. NPDC002573 TaxID=3364651 RepID=UPI0036AE51E9